MKYFKWFPELHQIYFPGKNPSYLNSLWIGIISPFLLLPILIYRMLLKPFFYNFFMLITLLFGIFLGGILGTANSRDIDAHEMAIKILTKQFGAKFMSDEEEK